MYNALEVFRFETEQALQQAYHPKNEEIHYHTVHTGNMSYNTCKLSTLGRLVVDSIEFKTLSNAIIFKKICSYVYIIVVHR